MNCCLRVLVALSVSAFASLAIFGQTSVLTQHNDVTRTGQNLSETILTPAAVQSGNFGQIFSLAVDGTVEAQPLYMPGLTVGGATHNVVFVATEHDGVFAFDADTGGSPLWQATLLDAAHGAAPGATTDPVTNRTGCYVPGVEYGITGTPVIDPSTGTLYVVSDTLEGGQSVQRLHALDIYSGNEKFNGPTTIAATVASTTIGSGGFYSFNAEVEDQRAGLALLNGQVYIAFGSHCDWSNFHGWLFAYSASNLSQTSVFLSAPNGVDSVIWMSVSAPSIDPEDNSLYVTTGNGTFDATAPYAVNTMDYGDDILKLNVSNGISVTDVFTPYNQASLQASDIDFGAGGALILPAQSGPYPHLLVTSGKDGTIYLINRDSLGGYNAVADNIPQEVTGQLGYSFGGAAYWNGNLYFWPAADHLKQFSLTDGVLSTTPVATSTEVQPTGYPAGGIGSSSSISANGTTGAIVWSVDSSQTPQILYAHDATNVANTLWSSATNAANTAGNPTKFPVPTIVNGKVYVGTASAKVVVYGLSDFSLSAASSSLTLTPSQTITDTISISPVNGFAGAITFAASGLPTGVTASFATTSSATVATFAASSAPASGTYSVTITGTSGTISHSVTATLLISGTGDFSIASTLNSLSVSPGSQATDTINISSLSGFNGVVILNTLNLPPGVTASFTASGTNLPTSVATFTAASSAVQGTYPISIIGTSGALSHTVPVALVVNAPPTFSVTSSSASVSLTQGQTATAKISAASEWFTVSATFAASNLPSGVAASFSPATGPSSVVTFTAATTATPGSYAVTVTATSATASNSVVVPMIVVAAPDFTVTPASTTVNVSAGSSATTQLTLAPNTNFTGTIALSCSVASSLTNVTCSIPATVPSGTTSATLTVNAGATARTPFWHKLPQGPENGNGRLMWLMAGLLLATCIFAMTQPRKLRILAAGFAVILVMGLSSCRGGGAPTSTTIVDQPNAVAETGNITVTATSGSISHTATVSISVQ